MLPRSWVRVPGGPLGYFSSFSGIVDLLYLSIYIYISYIRPILEYSSIVWDGCSEQNVELLEKLQHDGARIVTGLTRSVSLNNLYKECGLPSLAIRSKYQIKNLTLCKKQYILCFLNIFLRDISPFRKRPNELPINKP